MKEYQGKYSKDEFFQRDILPRWSAFGRNRLKKLARKVFLELLREKYSDKTHLDLAGLYSFHILRVPKTERDIQEFKRGLDDGLRRIVDDSRFRQEVLREANRLSFNTERLERERFSAILRPWKEPFKVPSPTPFLKKE